VRGGGECCDGVRTSQAKYFERLETERERERRRSNCTPLHCQSSIQMAPDLNESVVERSAASSRAPSIRLNPTLETSVEGRLETRFATRRKEAIEREREKERGEQRRRSRRRGRDAKANFAKTSERDFWPLTTNFDREEFESPLQSFSVGHPTQMVASVRCQDVRSDSGKWRVGCASARLPRICSSSV
jgi:hypothetical protein